MSAIVIDDIDKLIEFSPIGPRFSNKIFQALTVLLKTPPPSTRKLCIFVTTHNIEAMRLIGLEASIFYHEVNLRPISNVDEIKKIGTEVNKISFAVDSNTEIPKIPIKTLIEILDYCKIKDKSSALDWFDISSEIQCHTLKDSL
jgi:vesicle-fusing ATPase